MSGSKANRRKTGWRWSKSCQTLKPCPRRSQLWRASGESLPGSKAASLAASETRAAQPRRRYADENRFRMERHITPTCETCARHGRATFNGAAFERTLQFIVTKEKYFLCPRYPKAYSQRLWVTSAVFPLGPPSGGDFSAAMSGSRTLSKPATYCGFSERASRLA